jgi:hypothetical protein
MRLALHAGAAGHRIRGLEVDIGAHLGARDIGRRRLRCRDTGWVLVDDRRGRKATGGNRGTRTYCHYKQKKFHTLSFPLNLGRLRGRPRVLCGLSRHTYCAG